MVEVFMQLLDESRLGEARVSLTVNRKLNVFSEDGSRNLLKEETQS